MKRVVGTILAGVLLAGSWVAPASASTTTREPQVGLGQLTELVVQRLEVGDLVAASKFGTDKPIDDPAREKVVLDQARASAIQLGIDPDETVTFFRDQIEASKVVQRGLFARWTAHPDQAPTTRPDLNEIRLKLDQLTTELLHQLRSTTYVRHTPIRCAVDLTTSSIVTGVQHHLDHLHTQALTEAVADICS
jgi:chorismate mutase